MIESEENKAESEPAEATEEVEMADREEVNVAHSRSFSQRLNLLTQFCNRTPVVK